VIGRLSSATNWFGLLHNTERMTKASMGRTLGKLGQGKSGRYGLSLGLRLLMLRETKGNPGCMGEWKRKGGKKRGENGVGLSRLLGCCG
jgi:hypothetical protein